MTTTSLGTAAPATPRHDWRVTWADRENARRRRIHQTEVDAWTGRADELTRQRIEAAGFLGAAQPRTGLPVELDSDELVYRVLPAVELVEAVARHVPGLPQPALTVGPPVVTGRALPRGLRVVDAGLAVVTNHRVAFGGREQQREWRYADLLGPAHHPQVPLTLLHTAAPARLAGLLVPATTVANTRFYLTLSVAAARGERATVVAQLDALAVAHQRRRPTPPAPAQPHEAPLTAVRPERRAMAATVAMLALASFSATAGGSEQDRPRYEIGAGAVDTQGPWAIGPVVPTLPNEPVTPAIGVVTPITGPTPPASRGDTHARPTAPETPEGTAPTWRRESPDGGGGTGPGTAPAPAPTTAPTPATTTAPVPAPSSPPPTAAPAPTNPPSSSRPQLLTLCLDPIQLPLLDPLLCPRD